MDRAAADATGGFHLTVGVVIGIKEAERFRDTLLQIAAVPLEGLGAADVGIPEVEGGLARVDPVGERHPCPAGRDNADGVIASRHPVPPKLGRFAEVVAVVGGEAFWVR